MLEKAEEESQAAPKNTPFHVCVALFVFYSLVITNMCMVQMTKIYFLTPTDEYYSSEDSTDAGKAGGVNRSLIQGSGYLNPFVPCRDKFTSNHASPYILVHL